MRTILFLFLSQIAIASSIFSIATTTGTASIFKNVFPGSFQRLLYSYSGSTPWSHANSVDFNGSSSLLSIDSGINVGGSTAQTWITWIKVNSFTGNPGIAVSLDGTRSQYFYIDHSRGERIAIDWFDASHELFGFIGNPMTSSTWSQIAIVNSGTNRITGFTVYLNGIAQSLSTTINNAGGSYQSTAALHLMNYSTTFTNGRMNSYAVYNAALSSSDITAAYNGGVPVDLSTLSSYSNIVAWYEMGNCAGDTTSTIKNCANPGTLDATGTSVTIVADSP